MTTPAVDLPETSRRHRTAELELVAAVSSALRRARTLAEMLPILLDATIRTFKADTGVILLRDETGLRLQAIHGLPGWSQGLHCQPGEGLLWQLLSHGRSTQIPLNQIPEHTRCPFVAALAESMATLLVIPLAAGEQKIGLLALAYRQPPQDVQPDQPPLQAIAEMAGNALQRAMIMETLEQRVLDRTRMLTALYEVAAATNEPRALAETLDQVLGRILLALHGTAALLHIKDTSATLRLAAQRGLAPALSRPRTPAVSERMPWYQVLDARQHLIMPELPAALRSALAAQPAGPLCYVGAPVHARGQTVGTLSFILPSHEAVSPDDIALITAVADHLGNAVERDRLHQQAEQAAVMDERQRLARELHDSVTQALYSLTLFAAAGQDAAAVANHIQVQHYLSRLADTAQQALREMRLLIYQLRPLALQQDGLVGALRQRLETVERRAGIEVQITTTSIPLLPASVEADLFRVVQEALNNALKHAASTRLLVQIAEEDDQLLVTVTDNGIGFDLQAPVKPGGIGLASMRERVMRLGGTLEIQTASGQGTTISVRLPASTAFAGGSVFMESDDESDDPDFDCR